MSRPTPFELVIGDMADDWFPPIRDEEISRETEASNPAAFARLNSVQALLKELQPPDGDDAHPDEVEAYLGFLFAAYSMWRRGAIVDIDQKLLDSPGADPEPDNLTDMVVYGRLPERSVWSQVIEEGPHEPLDGVFVATLGGEAFVLAVLGMHESRSGFSQVSLGAALEDLTRCREESRENPLEPAMDGGREAGFYSITCNAELLLLARLALVRATR